MIRNSKGVKMKDFNNKINIEDIQDPTSDFYISFKEKLNAVEQFPSFYTFKFIVKSDSDNNERVKTIFDHPSVKFSDKASSGGKYTSITVQAFVNNADEVIDYYKKAAEIPDIMML